MKLQLAIREYLKEIEVRKYSPRTIRTYRNNLGLFLRFCEETGITEAEEVRMGTNLYTISRLLGHENIGITQTYLNSLRDEDVIQVAKQRSVLMS